MSHWHSVDGDFTIILPTLNEGENIVPMLETLRRLYPSSRVLVVDDSSTDGTPEKVTSYSRSDSNVTLVKRETSDRGLTASILDGIVMSQTPYFVVLDADFQHPPEAIAPVMDEILRGNDLVVGIRKDKRKLPTIRKISSGGAHKMAAAYLGLRGKPRCRDMMSGFFGGKTEVSKGIIIREFSHFERQGFKALFDLLKFAPKDLKVSEIEFEFGERRGGSSKLDSRVVLSIMRQCGVGGKALAIATNFFLLSMLGRFMGALILGLFSTFVFLTWTGEEWSHVIVFPTVISFLLAVGYIVIANQFLSDRKRTDGLVRGMQVIGTAFSGYVINLSLFYIVATEIPAFQILPTFLGFGIAAGWDTIGANIQTK